jgi:glycosyltransferase involved in cell wall biosynthesis
MPVLSIVIPAFNVERFIIPSVVSALGQTYRDIEVIVVDDGSTDGTAEKISTIHDSRLKVIAQSNRGLSAARNAGICLAQGKYIGLLDGDDVWTSRKAAIHIALMERNPKIGISYSNLRYINERGQGTGEYLISKVRIPTIKDFFARNLIIPSSAIIRKDCFVKAGLFDETLRSIEDYDMWLRILWKTDYEAHLIPMPLAEYRVRSNSLSEEFGTFLHNAHVAMEKFQCSIPVFSEKDRNRALAEIYRTCSRKALYNWNFGLSKKYMIRAIRLCPSLCFRDARALGTLVLLFGYINLPDRVRKYIHLCLQVVVAACYKSFFKLRCSKMTRLSGE